MEKTQNFKSTVFACYRGYITQGIVNNLSPLFFVLFQNKFGISYSLISALILCNFVTQVITDMLSVKYVDRIGYRKSAVIAHALAFLGLVMQGTLPNVLPAPYVGLVLATIVNGVGGGLIEVIISPIVDSCPGDAKASAMSLLHSFYCWGQAITTIGTTLLLHAFGYKGWSYIPLLWAVIPFFNAFSFFKVPIVEPEPERKSDSFKTLFKSRLFRCFMIMMLCSGAAEIAMAEWASMFAQKALGISKVIGDLAGPCAFAVFMGLGRVLYAAFSEKISFKKTVIAMSTLCAACYYVAAFSKSPILALSACALCGFTVSLFWPGTLSAGSRAFPKGDAVMFSVFAMCGDIGCCIGPWLLGIIADVTDLHVGFAVSSVFPIIMIITAVLFFKEEKIAGKQTP